MSQSLELSGSPKGYESLTGSDTAQGITEAKRYVASENAHAKRAFISNTAQSIRWEFDAANLAGGGGHLLAAGDVLQLNNSDQIQKWVFVDAVSGSHGVVKISTFF